MRCYDDAWWGYDALALFGRHKGALSHDTLRMALRRISAKMVASPALSQAWCEDVAANVFSRWWLQICIIFIPIWGENDPIWLRFFKCVETTNQFLFFHHRFFLVWCVYRLATWINKWQTSPFQSHSYLFGHHPAKTNLRCCGLVGRIGNLQEDSIWWCLPLVESS